MISIDTNVLVRLLVDDDAEQARRARRLVQSGDVMLVTSVILETAWVLRRSYRLDHADVLAAIRGFIDLPNTTLSEPEVVRQAIALAEEGFDLGDAIHIASARRCAAFVTFDKELQKKAAKIAPVPVRAP